MLRWSSCSRSKSLLLRIDPTEGCCSSSKFRQTKESVRQILTDFKGTVSVDKTRTGWWEHHMLPTQFNNWFQLIPENTWTEARQRQKWSRSSIRKCRIWGVTNSNGDFSNLEALKKSLLLHCQGPAMVYLLFDTTIVVKVRRIKRVLHIRHPRGRELLFQ